MRYQMRKHIPDFDRLRKVLQRQGEPDRVPLYELFADGVVMEAILGRRVLNERDLIEYQMLIGYDYTYAKVGGCGFPTTGLASTTDTADLSWGQRTFHQGSMGCIRSWEDFHKYQWPDPTKYDYSSFERNEKVMPDGMKINMLAGSVLEEAMNLMGYEGLSLAAYDQPELVAALFQRIGESYEAAYKVCAPMESVGVLTISDDLGFKTATMFSPDFLREHVFPWYKRYCDICHAYNKPVIIHSCGNLTAVYNDLASCGIDAKHSYEDQILPVTEMKVRHGDQFAVLGGIDMHFLCQASEDEVRERVREVLQVCMPGGGYALGTGNTVANYIPVGNFLAMVDECHTIGIY